MLVSGHVVVINVSNGALLSASCPYGDVNPIFVLPPSMQSSAVNEVGCSISPSCDRCNGLARNGDFG